jgi:nucleoside-diphosphate-sugar epimerase
VNGNVTRGRPFSEADTPAPVEPYARSKRRSEQELQAADVEWVVVRPPLVYGANAPGNFARLVHAVARGWPLPLAAVKNQRSLVGVRNLCDFLLACCTHPAAANETFVIADGEDLATPDIVRSIADGLRKPARLWSLPVPLLEAAAMLAGKKRLAESLCASLQVDASKARRLLGWKPLADSREGIAQAAAGWRFA